MYQYIVQSCELHFGVNPLLELTLHNIVNSLGEIMYASAVRLELDWHFVWCSVRNYHDPYRKRRERWQRDVWEFPHQFNDGGGFCDTTK